MTDRLWRRVLRWCVEIMTVLAYPHCVSSIRSGGGRFSSWRSVNIQHISVLGTRLRIAMLIGVNLGKSLFMAWVSPVRVLAWLLSRMSLCTRVARALELTEDLVTYRLLPWGNSRAGSAILPCTLFGIYWGPRLLGRPAFWWRVGRHGALVGRLTRGLGSTPMMIHMGGGLAMPKWFW